MRSHNLHRIDRHPSSPWAELRTSVRSTDGYRAHSHAEYSIGIVDQGEAIFHHPDGPEKLSSGAAVLIEPNVTHFCNPTQCQNWSYRMLFINADWLHQEVAQKGLNEGSIRALRFQSRGIHDGAICQRVDSLCRAVASQADAVQWGLDLVNLVIHQAVPCEPEAPSCARQPWSPPLPRCGRVWTPCPRYRPWRKRAA